MDQHLGLRVFALDRQHCAVGQGVGHRQAQLAGQLEMQLDEPVVAGDPRAHVVRAEHSRHAAGKFAHALADVGGQFPVHQDRHRLASDLQGAPEDVQGDAQAEQAVALRPAVAGQEQCHEDACVEQQVRAVVQRVGAYRGGTGAADDVGLEGEEKGREQQRQQHHRDAPGGRAEGLRVAQLLDRLDSHQHRAGTDEHGLGQAGQGLGLAVAVAVVVVGRAQRIVHRQQVEQRGGTVQQGVGEAGEQAHRTAQPPGDGLADDQGDGDTERGQGGQAQQAGVGGIGTHGALLAEGTAPL